MFKSIFRGVAINVIHLIVIIVILSNLHGRTEMIVVPILGIIYMSINVMGVDLFYRRDEQEIRIERLWARVEALADPNFLFTEAEVGEAEKRLRDIRESNGVRYYIDLTFQLLITLYCLSKIFSGLNS